jgi:hypothetical protein
MHHKTIQNSLRFWTNLYGVQFYRVRSYIRACATLAEHDSPNKCGVSAPGTVDGLYSLGEFLQCRKGAIWYANYECAKAERILKRMEEKNSGMRKMWVDAVAKITCVWRKEGKLKALYICS